MITAYLTGAAVMAWHLWTRRARHVRRGLSWASAGRYIDGALQVLFWPYHILASLLDA